MLPPKLIIIETVYSSSPKQFLYNVQIMLDTTTAECVHVDEMTYIKNYQLTIQAKWHHEVLGTIVTSLLIMLGTAKAE